MNHIAHRVDVRAGTMTQIADRLEDNGYIERIRERSDRRIVYVKATRVGAKLIARAEQKATEVAAA